MKWKKKPPAKQNQAEPEREVDWLHLTVIDHVMYAYPDVFTGCPAYPNVDDEKFAALEAEAAAKIGQLNLSVESAPALDALVRLQALQLAVTSVAQTRLLHHRHALHRRSDTLLQLHNLQASLMLIEEELAEINKEIDQFEQVKCKK